MSSLRPTSQSSEIFVSDVDGDLSEVVEVIENNVELEDNTIEDGQAESVAALPIVTNTEDCIDQNMMVMRETHLRRM